jgi:hypothetical protein
LEVSGGVRPIYGLLGVKRLIVNAHVYLTAYDTGNVSGTLHNALPKQKPHSKRSPEPSTCALCSSSEVCDCADPSLRNGLQYCVYRSLPKHTVHGHIDAAITLLTFRLHTTTELLSTQVYSIYTSKQHTVLAVWTLL